MLKYVLEKKNEQNIQRRNKNRYYISNMLKYKKDRNVFRWNVKWLYNNYIINVSFYLCNLNEKKNLYVLFIFIVHKKTIGPLNKATQGK